MLSLVLERFGESKSAMEKRVQALALYNELQPGNETTLDALQWNHLQKLIYYDYF